MLGPASGGSEPVVTGSVLLAFGFGWGLLAYLSTRFSAQPQGWTYVPAMVLGSVGLGLILVQPDPVAMDLLGWIWPPALAVLAIWMVVQARRNLRGRGRWLVAPMIGDAPRLRGGRGSHDPRRRDGFERRPRRPAR